MTLVLLAVHRNFIVQVSDRLITAAGKEVDRFSNKIIVYRARDAIVVLGYTGIAFIDGRPTDEWIAERLFGEQTKSGMLFQRRSKHSRMDLGMAMLRLRSELEQAAGRMSRVKLAHGLKISVFGWQGSRRTFRSLIISLEKKAGSKEIDFDHMRRDNEDNGILYVDTVGWLKTCPEFVKFLYSKVEQNEALLQKDPNATIEHLVNVIRLVSRSVESVGPDVMSVFLPRPPGVVEVKYHHRSSSDQKFSIQEKDTIAMTFLPLIVMAGGLFGPSVVTQDWLFESLGTKIMIRKPTAGDDHFDIPKNLFHEGKVIASGYKRPKY